jgi:CHAT domain-containing protein
MTKLEALRLAQLSLLYGTLKVAVQRLAGRAVIQPPVTSPGAAKFMLDRNAPYAHPFYWAPFFLMGNWL